MYKQCFRLAVIDQEDVRKYIQERKLIEEVMEPTIVNTVKYEGREIRAWMTKREFLKVKDKVWERVNSIFIDKTEVETYIDMDSGTKEREHIRLREIEEKVKIKFEKIDREEMCIQEKTSTDNRPIKFRYRITIIGTPNNIRLSFSKI